MLLESQKYDKLGKETTKKKKRGRGMEWLYEIQDQLPSMSRERIVQLAEENPLIPKEDIQNDASEEVAYAAEVQGYVNSLLSLPDVTLPEVPTLPATQTLARENAAIWVETLNPKIRNTYTEIKSWCNLYGALDDASIDSLVDAAQASDAGKEEFDEVMNYFISEAERHEGNAASVASDLNSFSRVLEADLRSFFEIKTQVIQAYTSQNAQIDQLQSEVEYLSAAVLQVSNSLLTDIMNGLGAVSSGILPGYFAVQCFTATKFTAAGKIAGVVFSILTLITLAAAITQFALQIKARNELNESYLEAQNKLIELQESVATLESFSENFGGIIDQNDAARSALLRITNAWTTIVNNLRGIKERAQQGMDHTIDFLIKTTLKAARTDVNDLKNFMVECEKNGVLPVIPDETLRKNVGRLTFPSSWVGQSIPGEVFQSFFIAKHKDLRSIRGKNWEKWLRNKLLQQCYCN